MASDYGGDRRESDFESYSFLIADAGGLGEWRARMNRLRDTILTDGRTISFKDRNSDAVQRRAEPHFLAAANTIPGVVATILVDRTVPSVRMFPPREEFAVTGSNTPAAAMFTNWKQPTFERLMRIAWFGTTIFAGLSTPEQHLLWITDNDDIVANDGRTQTFGVSVAAVRLWMQPGMSPPRLDVTRPASWPTPAKRLALEDLLSVADYAAGAVPAALTVGQHHGHSIASPLIQLLPAATPADILKLHAWVAEDQWPLKRWVFVFRRGANPGSWDYGSVRVRRYN